MKLLLAVGIGLIVGASLQSGARWSYASQAQRSPGGGFTEPSPMDFNDHEGYVSLFDGASLKGWDGNPKFWRVENGVHCRRVDTHEPERQQLHRLPRPRSERLHAEVRDQS